LETRPAPGAKIRVSGGGRCNVLPSHVDLDDFHTSGSRNTMRNILLSWPLAEVRAFFEEDLGLPLKVERTGKVFPASDRSRDVVEALLRALRDSGARLRSPFRVASVERGDDGRFRVLSTEGERLDADRLVLATGGLSLPKTGSDGAGLDMATHLGHSRVPTYPALVPLRSDAAAWRALSGVAAPVRMRVEASGRLVDEREGDLLVTHRGFSGPIILDVSHHLTRAESRGTERPILTVHWGAGAVDDWDATLREGGRTTVGGAVRRHLPDRLAAHLIEVAGVEPARRLSELSRAARGRLTDALGHFTLPVRGNEGYAKAEVTGGGIPLDEITSGTLESRIVPGLHLCGEILDVTGRLGGYNFLWAWVTGRKAGLAIASLH
jgi:predicted Rossmann fold flavoprotein